MTSFGIAENTWKNISLKNMKGEIWKDVVGMEGCYMVSSRGRLKSIERWVSVNGGKRLQPMRILKQYKSRGYLRSIFSIDGVKMHKLSHILVATAFIPNPEKKPEVNHKRGIRHDNRIQKLEWATKSEQQQHAINVLGKHTRGWNSPLSKTTKEQAREIYESELPIKKIKEMYGIGDALIYRIKRGKSWYLKGVPSKRKNKPYTVEFILEIYNSPLNSYQAAKKYGISTNITWGIKNGKLHKKITNHGVE